MTTRVYETEFRTAFELSSSIARAIANHVVSGVDVPADLVDDYARARGAVDRLVEAAEERRESRWTVRRLVDGEVR
jgi:hypothetical protein